MQDGTVRAVYSWQAGRTEGVETMARKHTDWVIGTAWIDSHEYHTFNPPHHTGEHKHIAPTPKHTILLDSGFIARPVYQTYQTTDCSFCTIVKFLGYQLVEQSSGWLWREPRPLAAIRAQHASIILTIKAARSFAIGTARALAPAGDHEVEDQIRNAA